MAPFPIKTEPPGLVDLTTDSDTEAVNSEDEELRQAIALSLQSHQDESKQPPPVEAPINETQKAPASLNSLLGMNRKAMEEERLTRLKRKRGEEGGSVSPPPLTRRARPSPVTAAQSTSRISASTKSLPITAVKPLTPVSTTTLRFPNPTVLKTWCLNQPRGDPSIDIKLEELLDRSNLQSCVLSSFIWNLDWLLPKLDTNRTKFVLVMHGKDPRQRTQLHSDFNGIPNVRLCFPPMDGNINCMHSKLMLLFYPTYLRIVVPTANLVPFDWGEDGIMENTVFVIDLPRLQPDPPHSPKTLFHDSLKAFLIAQTLPSDVIQKLSQFDFTATSRIGFVHSIGGSHGRDTWKATGHPGLGGTVSSLGLHTTQKIQADFVTSSVGSLNAEFLRSIYLAAQGDDGLTEYNLRVATKTPKKTSSRPTSIPEDAYPEITRGRRTEWKDNFRFYFPSEATVAASRGGTGKAGTICFAERWWDGAQFPRDNMRDCVSDREGLLMHNKILFVRFPKPVMAAPPPAYLAKEPSLEYVGWAYVGSANLSESAWGRLVREATTKSPKLVLKSWECGVVIPVVRKENVVSHVQTKAGEAADPVLKQKEKVVGAILKDTEGISDDGSTLLDLNQVFDGTIPVPMRYPGEMLGAKRPWFFED